MKILIATGLYPPEVGGPATYAILLEKTLPQRGISVAVLPYREVRHLPKLVRHLAYFFKCLALSLSKGGCDAVYAQDVVSVGLPAALAAMLARKKFLVRVPGDYAWEQGRQRFGVKDELDAFQSKKYGFIVETLRRVERFVVRRASAVVVPSDYMKKIVIRWGTRPERVHCIYSSIELPEVVPLAQRPAGFLIVSSGRRVPWKGFDALARVVAQEKSWTLNICENLPRAQVLGWVKAADVFVLNSTYEGLSHALVEAMMLGTPVVATRVGGNPELIADDVDGLLIEPKDDEALFAALKAVEADPAGAAKRAAAAKIRAQDFSIDKTVGQLCDVLQTL